MNRTVLGIAGSPRRGGNSDILLEAALEGAREAGAETAAIFVRDLDISGCLECGGCDETGVCVVDDEMTRVYEAIESSDAIILATPIFFYAMPSWVKAVIDRSQCLWMRKYALKTDPARARKGALIAVGATRGKRLFDGITLTAKYFFDTFNAEIVDELLVPGVEKKGDITSHPELLDKAREIGVRLAAME
jgi:multimeric flavodoxin WrbA